MNALLHIGNQLCSSLCNLFRLSSSRTGWGRYYIFEDAKAFGESASQYAEHIDNLKATSSIQCNPFDSNPRSTLGWPSRCLVPCVQYGFLDEPYFNYAITTELLGLAHRPLCPCMNSTVYEVEREYEGDKGAFMSESWQHL